MNNLWRWESRLLPVSNLGPASNLVAMLEKHPGVQHYVVPIMALEKLNNRGPGSHDYAFPLLLLRQRPFTEEQKPFST